MIYTFRVMKIPVMVDSWLGDAREAGSQCSCPIYWAIVPDESGNYENLGVKTLQNAQN